jgi:hypothetical protein
MNKLLTLLAGLTATIALASGTVEIQGKLVSMTDTDYIIETATQVFSIQRSAVTKDQASKMEHTEIQVALTVPFQAIDNVHAKNK